MLPGCGSIVADFRRSQRERERDDLRRDPERLLVERDRERPLVVERDAARLRVLLLRPAFELLLLRPPALDGTLAPRSRASESPMAIACFRLFTARPERPDFN